MTEERDIRGGASANVRAVSSSGLEEGVVLFLGPDLLALDAEIGMLRESVCYYSEVALPEGEAAEAVMAEFHGVLDRLSYLTGLRRSAVLVACPVDVLEVDLGVTVKYLTLGAAVSEPEQVSIGSVFVSADLAGRGFVSYLSDLGLLLRGAVPGDVRQGVVSGEEVAVRVLAVDSALSLLLPS